MRDETEVASRITSKGAPVGHIFPKIIYRILAEPQPGNQGLFASSIRRASSLVKQPSGLTMTDAGDPTTTDFSDMAANIVSAYVMNNSVNAADLPRLIGDVHSALLGLGAAPSEEVAELVPAVSIRKSITPDFLICLDDGKRFKSLKRHIGQLGMTPAEYRQKWNLPGDYPMVAPNYSAVRSGLAKTNGLGRKPAEKAPPTTKRPRVKA